MCECVSGWRLLGLRAATGPRKARFCAPVLGLGGHEPLLLGGQRQRPPGQPGRDPAEGGGPSQGAPLTCGTKLGVSAFSNTASQFTSAR